MQLLHLDDSGSVSNTQDWHIVLAGLAVGERSTFWLMKELDTLAAAYRPDQPGELEFRGADMMSGKKQWRSMARSEREAAYRQALGILGGAHDVRLFGATIHKEAKPLEDPMEFAFEQMINRFDLFLTRLHRNNNTQRGLVVLDKSSYETNLQRLATGFRDSGHRWGRLRNIAEVPLFVDSRATRMIQFADLVAHALRRYIERGIADQFDIIAKKFDAEGGTIHGLLHQIPRGRGLRVRRLPLARPAHRTSPRATAG